ncbi:MAG: DUF7718 family protein [Chthoniobacterales bacterium]
MAKENWTEFLPDGFVLQIYIHTFLGRVVAFSVSLVCDDKCVTRYDTAHGFAHRDVLGMKNGFLRKIHCDNLNYGEAFRYARDDLSRNFAKHYDYYRQH